MILSRGKHLDQKGLNVCLKKPVWEQFSFLVASNQRIVEEEMHVRLQQCRIPSLDGYRPSYQHRTIDDLAGDQERHKSPHGYYIYALDKTVWWALAHKEAIYCHIIWQCVEHSDTHEPASSHCVIDGWKSLTALLKMMEYIIYCCFFFIEWIIHLWAVHTWELSGDCWFATDQSASSAAGKCKNPYYGSSFSECPTNGSDTLLVVTVAEKTKNFRMILSI